MNKEMTFSSLITRIELPMRT